MSDRAKSKKHKRRKSTLSVDESVEIFTIPTRSKHSHKRKRHHSTADNKRVNSNANEGISQSKDTGEKVSNLAGEIKSIDENRRKKDRSKGYFLLAALLSTLLAIAAIAGGSYWYLSSQFNKSISGEKLDVSTVAPKADSYTILAMGFDKRPGEKSYRSDTMLLIQVDPDTNTMWVLSILRDTRVFVPNVGEAKAGEAYAYGKEQYTIEAIQNLTEVEINYFVGIDFEGFKAITDQLGGVEVDIPQKFEDAGADNSVSGNASVFKAGRQVMDGDQALQFVRTRKIFADQDYTRVENQRLFVRSLANQVRKATLQKMPGIVNSALPYLSTNIPLVKLMGIAGDVYQVRTTHSTTLPGVWKSPYVIPTEKSFDAVINAIDNKLPFGSEETE